MAEDNLAVVNARIEGLQYRPQKRCAGADSAADAIGKTADTTGVGVQTRRDAAVRAPGDRLHLQGDLIR
jgi:hypothetical protein